MKEPCQYPKKIESVGHPAGKYPLLLEPIHSVLVSSKMSFSTDQLIALQALVAKELMNRGSGSSSSSSAPVKAKKVKKEKDPSAKPRKAGAWAGWTSHCPKEHAAEYETFKASSATKQGIAPLFCTQWRKDHADEYAAFEVKWKEEHSSAEPSSAEPSSAEPSPASSAPAPAPAAPQKASQEVKVRKPQSEETKAAAALKRAATKAKNAAEGASALAAAVTSAAPAPAPAPVLPLAPISVPAPAQEDEAEAEEDEDEEMPELLPFELGRRSYLRPGGLRDGGITSWATGDLWESKKGLKGVWAGVLQEDGTIDLNADEPEC